MTYLNLLGGFNLKHKIPIFITLVLALALIVSVTSMTALAAHDDYSNPNSTAERITLNSADILEIALGIELTEAERDYLAQYGNESISYSDMIPASYVTCAYDEENRVLNVYAQVYEYSTSGGLTKTWTPKAATVGDATAEMALGAGGKYTCEVKNVERDAAATLDVTYTMSFVVSASVLNSLMNKAVSDAPAWDAYAGYLKAKEEYYAAEEAYKAYLVDKSVYEAKLAEYNAYLDDLAEYEADLLVYAEYEAALVQYGVDYSKYLDYLDRVDKYDDALAAYNLYIDKLENAHYLISILDGTAERKTPLNRSIKDAVMGSTVTTVLENRDAIANSISGIDPAVVDKAGVCTDNLRAFYSEYEPLDNARDKYTYYVMNYEKVRDNLVGLFQCLDHLYGSGYVREGVKRKGLTEKFEILLAQLYYTVLTISDDPVSHYGNPNKYYDANYKIDTKSPLKIHYGEEYMTDLGDAKPPEGGYPAEVKKPEPITDVVTEPTKPTAVLRPVAPHVVENPGQAPTEVLRPTSPGAAPATPGALEGNGNLPATVIALISAYKNGEISARAEVTQGERITLEAKASKKAFETDEIVINFYDTNGNLLDTVNVERGSYVEFGGAVPTKREDAAATYTFGGWQDADGTPVDMRAVDCDGATLNLYPFFNADYKFYDVTWIVDGVKTVVKERYGSIPTPPVTPERSDTGTSYYEFSGWNREISPVSSSSVQNLYVATFESKYIMPFSNGMGATITVDGGDYVADCTLSADTSFDLSQLIVRAAGKGAIVLSSTMFNVRFSYTEVLAMAEHGVERVTVYSALSGVQGYSFYVELFDANGDVVNAGIKAAITLPYRIADIPNARAYYFVDGTLTQFKVTLTENALSATVTTGTVYYLNYFYAVDVIANDVVSISVSETSLISGGLVTIDAQAPFGVEIISYYIIKGNGERIDFNGTEFYMPADSVSVGVVYTYLEYTVKFVSGGIVISTATYRYGELPVIPSDPKKSADESYTYDFVGWDAEIVAVTEDATYNALYTATPIPVVPKPEGPVISEEVKEVIVEVVTVGLYALCVFSPLGIVILVKLTRRLVWFIPVKKRRKK